jgi:aerobic C4-dicarboxylate transport protein
VTGSGFITLAATLSSIPALPVGGLALLIGIDRFMSGARSLTNLIGNGLATIVVAKWDGQLDVKRLHRVFEGETVMEAEEPEEMLLVDHARYGS